MATIKVCSRCGGNMSAKRGRYGFYMIHHNESGKCPAGPARKTSTPRPTDPDQLAEYKAGASGFSEYANEVSCPYDDRD